VVALEVKDTEVTEVTGVMVSHHLLEAAHGLSVLQTVQEELPAPQAQAERLLVHIL
jgi:hypothetical protein